MAADLRNCSKCGRVFAYRGKDICSKCLEKMEKDYVIVRRYLQKHSGASIMEIQENTGVDEPTIIQFMREGRLVSENISHTLKCDNCGSSISEGRYCEKCLYEISNKLKSVMPVPEVNRVVHDRSSSIGGIMHSKDLRPNGQK